MALRWIPVVTSLWCCTAIAIATASAEEMPREEAGPAGDSNVFEIAMPSLDLTGVWGDLLVFRNYRIQERVDRPGECQLIDPANRIKKSGSYDDCRITLDAIRDKQKLAPLSGEVTLLIHGILRHSRSMGKVRTVMQEQGLNAEPFDYPSAKVSLEQSVRYLDATIKNLGPEVERINFVVHSMGGLLVRAYVKQAGSEVDPRLHRLVMLGTPNGGAQLASMLKDVGAFKSLYGPAGQQLVHADDAFVNELPIPPFEFAVIAGSRGNDNGWNPLIPGDDDGTVTIASARLPGAKDFRTFTTTHALMLYRRDVAESAVRFLQTGSLHEDGHCDPIPPAH